MKKTLLIGLLFCGFTSFAQSPLVDLSAVKKNGATVTVNQKLITVNWPAGKSGTAKMILDLDKSKPLIRSISLGKGKILKEITSSLDPAFVLTVGKRTLSPNSGGWDVFFDRVPKKPYKSYLVSIDKRSAKVTTSGQQTIVRISGARADRFEGAIEVTYYNGSPLFNVAAVLSTQTDSTAILYDAGLVNKGSLWKSMAWANVQDQMHHITPQPSDVSKNVEVKYRTIIGENPTGSLALFPAPHQYFYPLDEAFNLKFTWYGKDYHQLIPGFGMGIRQDPLGDNRYVPWFNAPPGTQQRLNFFCLLAEGNGEQALAEVKAFTHGDAYKPIAGFKTMSTHFHNEFISEVALSGKPIPEKPEFVDVLKKHGLNIVKLAEFHGPGHPKGPDNDRLRELQALFEQTKRLSDSNFLLLPGEEANNFYGGHWLAFFPKPVYWVMSRKADEPFVTENPALGKVYHIGNSAEMLKLLELEKGLAWTAHARTKGSTGYPDAYKDEPFFKSDTFLGAAWKAIPADLSIPTLSQRVLKLGDDMANWGLKKQVISEADIFTITHQNEMYAHLNVNYLEMDKLPNYSEGWQPVLDVMRKGRFFVSTGEVVIPSFNIDGKKSGETLTLSKTGKATVNMQLDWTFPMNYAEIVSGDGKNVYRERINLNNTRAFGNQKFSWPINLAGRKWVRVEAWDIAANGAFTQMIWIE
ncbi:CehA/McbA family metallohydrolase domain-containing protein [Pedobacter rhizosphaerae]|uniref:Uncharacterized protein n=1 Tax=Pedobacter rhizosphaerae TaxID=390241 RepID=A0A1H9U216_9SPHI|nr:hypothetical protein [Pedobacter rhizosphaerae]SES03322.1 hypothetical protein SAMN04488023_12648 [Pedobacter rhizosphaerae]